MAGTLPGWDADPMQGYPQHYVTSTHLYIYLGGERQGGVKFLSEETTRRPRPGLQPPTFRLKVQCIKASTLNALSKNISSDVLLIFAKINWV